MKNSILPKVSFNRIKIRKHKMQRIKNICIIFKSIGQFHFYPTIKQKVACVSISELFRGKAVPGS